MRSDSAVFDASLRARPPHDKVPAPMSLGRLPVESSDARPTFDLMAGGKAAFARILQRMDQAQRRDDVTRRIPRAIERANAALRVASINRQSLLEVLMLIRRDDVELLRTLQHALERSVRGTLKNVAQRVAQVFCNFTLAGIFSDAGNAI